MSGMLSTAVDLDGAAALLDWMERRRFSQREAGRFLGIHWTHINRLVTRHRRPSLEMGLMLQRKTGIPIESWADTHVVKYEHERQRGSRKRK